jgi:hypothetical protein
MLLILICLCLAMNFVSHAAALATQVEAPGAILAISVFGFILCRLRVQSRTRARGSEF